MIVIVIDIYIISPNYNPQRWKSKTVQNTKIIIIPTIVAGLTIWQNNLPCGVISSTILSVLRRSGKELNRWRESEGNRNRWTRGGRSGRWINESRKWKKTDKLTLWSLSGGRTMVRSIVFNTIFHNSFRTRFRTVFSQILANNIKLKKKEIQKQCQVKFNQTFTYGIYWWRLELWFSE